MRDYEKKLALLELQSIWGKVRYEKRKNSICINTNRSVQKERLEDLTFFSEVTYKNGSQDISVIPRQVKHELSAKVLKSKIDDIHHRDIYELIVNGKSNSRELRYLTHLMHEYKGRYNPQLCKALINIANIDKCSLVLDPFVGSGTTLVECLLNGYCGLGLDLNPLSYLITKVKIESLYLDMRLLKIKTDALIQTLQRKKDEHSIRSRDINSFYSEVATHFPIDLDYLIRWFPRGNLISILNIMTEILKISDTRLRNLFMLVLSDILINISYQDPNQLRIMRRSEDKVSKDVYGLYANNLKRYCNIVSTYQLVKTNRLKNTVYNYLGDVRNLQKELGLSDSSVDLIVTSPPYATALPYIDTDRLSLALMGYVNRTSLRNLETQMIGNREITQQKKEKLEEQLLIDTILPKSIKQLIIKIYNLNRKSNVGFRRKNTAALLYKYFSDMNQAMSEMYKVLRERKFCFMVVGCNNTIAGDKNIFIPTDDCISEIGKSVGFKFNSKIPLNIPLSYMIHKKNAIRRESILIFRKN